MNPLRFARPEYEAIARVCRAVDLHVCLPHDLKRLLVGALAEAEPALAQRLARLRLNHVQTLLRHLRADARPPAGPDTLTDAEVGELAVTFGPLLTSARFGRVLKRAVVRSLLPRSPGLAEKVHYLRPEQFEAVCQEVRRRLH
jgi:hypothetical protein